MPSRVNQAHRSAVQFSIVNPHRVRVTVGDDLEQAVHLLEYILRDLARNDPAVPLLRGLLVTYFVGMSLPEMERALILATLRHCDGNRTRTAQMLDISLRTLRNKLRAYQLPTRE